MRGIVAGMLLAFSALGGVGDVARASSTAEASEADLQLLADFFLPAEPMVAFVRDACRTAYRTKLTKTPGDIELERAIPGSHDRMVAAAGDYCDRNVAGTVSAHQARIKSDWRKLASPTDLHRLATLFRTETQSAQAIRLDVREGEMASDSLSRLQGPSASQKQAFRAKQLAFAKTPGGAALLDQVSAYQAKLAQEYKSGGWLQPLMMAALAEARRAANSFAREKGFLEPYPGK